MFGSVPPHAYGLSLPPLLPPSFGALPGGLAGLAGLSPHAHGQAPAPTSPGMPRSPTAVESLLLAAYMQQQHQHHQQQQQQQQPALLAHSRPSSVVSTPMFGATPAMAPQAPPPSRPIRAKRTSRGSDSYYGGDDGPYPAPASSSASASSTPTTKKRRVMTKTFPEELDGERRLAIRFTSYGHVGADPQRFGKDELLIPHGLRGKVTVLGQPWLVEVNHAPHRAVCPDGESRTLIQYVVVNTRSGHRHEVTETPSDAMRRSKKGRTICNRTFRDAVAVRERQLARLVASPDAPPEAAAELAEIRAHRVSEGPLLFGLRHQQVQLALFAQAGDGGGTGGAVAAASGSSSSSSEAEAEAADEEEHDQAGEGGEDEAPTTAAT